MTRIRPADQPLEAMASELLLGHNIEAVPNVVDGMLSERLVNPKFVGPANPQTGIAPGWQPRGNQMGRMDCELTMGMSLSGQESQYIHTFASIGAMGILQTGRYVEAGETLEVEFWAKVRRRPVTLTLTIGPLPVGQPCYDTAEVTVDAAYWKCYHATLHVDRDDANATFECLVEGEGIVWIDQIHLRPAGQRGVSPAMTRALERLRPPVIRFPGGCLSTNYHWRLGTGPVHLRPAVYDPVFKMNGAIYDFGIEEYLALCRQLDICPHITVNVGSDTPDEVWKCAEYCADTLRRDDGSLPAMYFQIGNENYGTWETSYMTGPMYVEVLREFVPGLRRAYPAARIIALGEPFCRGFHEPDVTPWCEPILDQAPDCFDVISLNRYKGQWFEDPVDRMQNAVDSVGKIERDLRDLGEDFRTRGLNKHAAITEWNLRLYTSHWAGSAVNEPDDAPHAFFVAGLVHAMAHLAPLVELANYFNLVNDMGLLTRTGPRVHAGSIVEVFRLYRPALPGRVIPLQCEPAAAESRPAIPPLALDNAAGTWVFVANAHPTASDRVEIDGLPRPLQESVLLSSSGIDGPLETRRDTVRSGDAIELPPLSLLRLAFAPAGARGT